MKLKKLLLVLVLVLTITLLAFPTALYAPHTDMVIPTAICSDNPSETRCWKVTNHNNFAIQFWHYSKRDTNDYVGGPLEIPANGSITFCVPTTDGSFGAVQSVYIRWTENRTDWLESLRVDTIEDSCPPAESVRTMPMTCWQVWINEEGNFQFIFWYLYSDNNWVRIYDMEDNLVFEEDLSDPNLIVDLPDGFYMVRTYYYGTMLQEFLIGKP